MLCSFLFFPTFLLSLNSTSWRSLIQQNIEIILISFYSCLMLHCINVSQSIKLVLSVFSNYKVLQLIGIRLHLSVFFLSVSLVWISKSEITGLKIKCVYIYKILLLEKFSSLNMYDFAFLLEKYERPFSQNLANRMCCQSFACFANLLDFFRGYLRKPSYSDEVKHPFMWLRVIFSELFVSSQFLQIQFLFLIFLEVLIY